MTATVPDHQGIKIVRSYTIRRPAGEIFAFWRNLENLVQVIRHPVSITTLSPNEHHWIASAPFGHDPVEWDSIIINEKKDRLIAWRSKEGSAIACAGSVRFEPAPDRLGTEVTVALEYIPPGGKLAGFVAKLSPEEPGHQVADTLRRCKALMETGEIPTITGQPVGEPQRSNQREKHESGMLQNR